MVNTDTIINRLREIMEFYALSPSAFADRIGVQRSGLSHLISGRNKPSLDFIIKITEVYPEVDLYWLLNGTGNLLRDNESPTDTPAASPPPVLNTMYENSAADLFSSATNTPVEEAITRTIKEENNFEDGHSEVETVVIFYKDGTFKSYSPGK